MPNGIIVNYTLTTAVLMMPSPTVVPGNTTTFEVMGFPPGAMVTSSVTASTPAGEGPPSNVVMVQLPGTVPHNAYHKW